MEVRIATLFATCLLTACTTDTKFNVKDTQAFHVDSFEIDTEQHCLRSDVNINDNRARKFFLRAKEVEYRVIHDHYDVAPCSASGSLLFHGQQCSWTINAGSFGWINCAGKPDELQHIFACDHCEDLLTPNDPAR